MRPDTPSRSLKAIAVMGAVGLVCTASAAAQQPAPMELVANSGNCTQFSQDAIWATSATWARARYRICLGLSPRGGNIKPFIQLHVDWPYDGCSLSIGFPPTASGSCPFFRTKEPVVRFRNFTRVGTRPAAIVIPLGIQGPGGLDYNGRCGFDARTYQSSLDGGASSSYLVNCGGPQMRRQAGLYTVTSGSPQADVRNDGDGPRALLAGSQQYISR